MKPVANLNHDLPRVRVVRAAKGRTVVEKESPVGNVQCVHGHGKSLAEFLAERQVKRRVPRQVEGRTALQSKAGSVVDIGGRIAVPRQREGTTHVQSVSLIVIQ